MEGRLPLVLVLFLVVAQSSAGYRPLEQYHSDGRYSSREGAGRRYVDHFLDYAEAATDHETSDLAYYEPQRFGKSTFDVTEYGAVGDGRTDSSNAFLRAWDDLCGATGGRPTLVIPHGKEFLLSPLSFKGPCKSKNLWIQALSFHSCNNLRVSGLQHVNSQKNHISINGCNDVDISHLKITAPEESPNTDGIDISASNHLHIHDSFIGTGDDCVAINGFSSYINISRVLCGPGHGISIGSLGKGGAYETVEEVHVEDCTFKGTMNGARIKTWKGGRGYARKISFERIRMINAGNPIIIDQTYVNRMAAASTASSSGDVEISDVSYKGVIGSSTDARAVYFNCGDGAGCRNIVVEDVEMTSAVAGKQLFAVCNNAHGTSSADRSPRVPCLLP
ncbi:unnamed protein product [Linum tenue]|uniref:Polygalacturonase n=1 Tax=Linum tenue TaxID=586396 RepID=A0AAV0I5K2_9ROSI|nr:unnamed protein product [Linum tenue]